MLVLFVSRYRIRLAQKSTRWKLIEMKACFRPREKVRFKKKKKKEKQPRKKGRNQEALDHAILQEKKQLVRSYFHQFPPQVKTSPADASDLCFGDVTTRGTEIKSV